MKVGEIDIKWEMGYEAASDLLKAIQTVAGSAGIKRVDGMDFKVYEIPGQGIRVDIAEEFYQV